MKLKFWESWLLKRAREKERQEWYQRIDKEGVNPSYKPKSTTVSKLTCPKCNSNQIKHAGYSDRFECKKCGHVFS